MYSFKEHEIGKWREGHKGFPDWSVLLQRHKEKLDKYPLSVVAIHPYELFGKVPYLLFNKKVMHFQISVHPDLMYVIDRFKKANNGFPVLRNTENTQSLAYYQGCNPFVINFDAFLKGEETFVAEYERIHTHFPAPMHLDDALELYRDWYIARKVSSFLEPQ